ncbi:MAG: hypothetical protein MJ186_02615 [Clostridia bacterium]|nr:hypothetical protein [Clostridia bacterium]
MIKIYPTTFKGTLEAPASKAHAQRLLFASALPNTATLVTNVPECEDINTTLQCLLDFGCTIEKHGETEIKVLPFAKTNPVPTADFNFRESGTTAHLAIPLAAAFGITANCKAAGNLIKRPLIPLSSRMAIRGVTFTGFNMPMTMKGMLQPGEYVFAGDEGSQYISGALMALPLLRDDSVIKLSSPIVDPAFIEITIDTLKQFGITIEETEDGFKIPGKQIYQTPGKVETITDWGLAAMWACAGCLSRSDSDLVEVTGLDSSSPQLYRDFKSVMSLLCHDVKYLNIDASKSPNLACLYAILAASKGSGLDIKGVPQLRYKETNRMKAVAECIKALGASANATEDGIHIEEQKAFDYAEGTKLNCMGDPWIFMSLALSAGCLPKPVILDDEHCADKIYKGFLKDYEALGGKYEIL